MTRSAGEKDTLVVVGAHPDDIACVGGIAAKYSARGSRVYSLSVTLGETVRKPGPEQEEVKRMREEEGVDIAAILGAEFVHMDVPCNKIIPTMDMKMKLVSVLRRLEANVLLMPTPWDVHADHRNLSWTMRDVVYYVGHGGIESDHPPCRLRGAYMFEIEIAHNELHEPDFAIDITDFADKKFEAIMSGKRARVFGEESGRLFMENERAWTRFWGMRYGMGYAEPLYRAHGSMATMDPVRRSKVLESIPAIDA